MTLSALTVITNGRTKLSIDVASPLKICWHNEGKDNPTRRLKASRDDILAQKDQNPDPEEALRYYMVSQTSNNVKTSHFHFTYIYA